MDGLDTRGAVVLFLASIFAFLALAAPRVALENATAYVTRLSVPPETLKTLDHSIVHLVLRNYEKTVASLTTASAKPLCATIATAAKKGVSDDVGKMGLTPENADGLRVAADALANELDAYIRAQHCSSAASPAVTNVAKLRQDMAQLIATFKK